MPDYKKLGLELGELVTTKQLQYGDSATRSAKILDILYPGGIPPSKYRDVLLLTRVLDKLSRIAESQPGKDIGGESPWTDIAGYAMLGWAGWSNDRSTSMQGRLIADYVGTGYCKKCLGPWMGLSSICSQCLARSKEGT